MTTDSVAYYDRHGERFAADTASVDMSALYDRFLRYVPAGGRILDAGCGVGRDTLAFEDRGYSVVAFDASGEMVRLARERVGRQAEVLQMPFQDAAWHEEFDGIWACASLLHVPASELPAVIRRLTTALRPGGAFYMSFKYGSGERIAGDRCFTDLDEYAVRAVLRGIHLQVGELWKTADARPGRSHEVWLNAVALRAKADEPAPTHASH